MKKILYITSDSWWDTDVTILPELIHQFDVEVYVASMALKSQNKFPDKVIEGAKNIHNINFVRTQYNPIMFVCSLFYFFRLLFASFKANYIFWVADTMVYYSIPFSFFCKKSKTIISFHNYIAHPGTTSLTSMLQNIFMKRFCLFHFHSPDQEKMFREDFPKKKSFSTNMPIKYLGECSNKKKIFDNNFRTFLFLGMIRDYKRPELFINAAEKYCGSANFILAGKADDMNKYENFSKSHSDNIFCKFDFLSTEEIVYFINEADFLVLPYDHTTQSGPLLIAYAYNKPIIATNLTYFSDMIENGKTGFLFNKGSQEQLNSIIERCSKMTYDEYLKMVNFTEEQRRRYCENSSFSKSLSLFIFDNVKL